LGLDGRSLAIIAMGNRIINNAVDKIFMEEEMVELDFYFREETRKLGK
jgi:hypothetical protein